MPALPGARTDFHACAFLRLLGQLLNLSDSAPSLGKGIKAPLHRLAVKVQERTRHKLSREWSPQVSLLLLPSYGATCHECGGMPGAGTWASGAGAQTGPNSLLDETALRNVCLYKSRSWKQVHLPISSHWPKHS